MPYASDRILQTEWVGASYETGAWTYTGAYYHERPEFLPERVWNRCVHAWCRLQ